MSETTPPDRTDEQPQEAEPSKPTRRYGLEPRRFYIPELDRELTAREIARHFGLSLTCVYGRLRQGHTSFERLKKGPKVQYYAIFNGKVMSLMEIKAVSGMPYGSMRQRYLRFHNPVEPINKKRFKPRD